MVQITDAFKIVLVVQLFYAFGITLLTNAVPINTLGFVSSFSEVADTINLQQVSSDIQTSIERQANMPLIDVGSLIFFSGNIILDLLLNFAFAIPQMLNIFIGGVLLLLNVDAFIFVQLQIFIGVFISVLYFFALIQFFSTG